MNSEGKARRRYGGRSENFEEKERPSGVYRICLLVFMGENNRDVILWPVDVLSAVLEC